MIRYIFISLIFIPFLCFSQNNIIIQQTNNNNSQVQYQKPDHSFYLQGISSTENIGGVDVETEGNSDPYGNPYMNSVKFKNYRNFAVTVLYKFLIGRSREEYREGSITLGPGETKYLSKRYNTPRDFKMIVRPL